MTTFHSDVVSIYAPSIGATIRFTGGTYSTDDPREIALLRRHGDVTEAIDEKQTREQLNERARELGVADPEKLSNKQAVVDAIKDAEATAADRGDDEPA